MDRVPLIYCIFGAVVISNTISEELSDYKAPARLQRPMQTQFRQINSGAPPDPYGQVTGAIIRPEITYNEPAANRIFDDIKEGLQYVLQTKNEWTFPVHGTGTTAKQAVLDSLIESGDKVLVLSIGYWGDIQANISKRLGASVFHQRKADGAKFTVREVEDALRARRPNILAMVMGETDTTVMQPMEGIGRLCDIYGALFVVDAVGVVGIQPVWTDKLKIDAVYVSSSKGLGSVAGLAAVSLSSRAVRKITFRRTLPRGYQTDLALQRTIYDTSNPNRYIYHTLSMPLLYGLREALAAIAEEQIEDTFERHSAATAQLSRGLEGMGLEYFVQNSTDRMIGFTAVFPPKGKDPFKVASYMLRNFNIEISAGYGSMKGRVLRFATFTSNANRRRVNNLLIALRAAFESSETNSKAKFQPHIAW